MTGLPAQVFRIKDRGVLRVGSYADVLVFDLSRINAILQLLQILISWLKVWWKCSWVENLPYQMVSLLGSWRVRS